MIRRQRIRSISLFARVARATLGIVAAVMGQGQSRAAISWDNGANTNWWFDPVNWSDANGYLPPYQSADGTNNPYPAANDAQINNGWNVANGGEGVIYDPDHDPNYAAVASATYFSPPFDVLKGQVLNRFYLSRNTPNTNILTIKSGSITFDARAADPNAPVITNTNGSMTDYRGTQAPTIIIGRSGSTETVQNEGRVIQLGGSFSTGAGATTLDIGQREAPTATNTANWGNGTWDYRGGTLLVQQTTGSQGIRLSGGSTTNGTGGVGKFIMHNPTTGGKVKTFDFTFCADGNNGDGVKTGVGIGEFHFENGNTRPIQIDRTLTINNGLDADGVGIRSARLDFKLDAAPTLTAGVPQNLGLFDVDFGSIGLNGSINGTGDADGNGTPSEDSDQVFWDITGKTLLSEGATVSATFGATKYNWTISYTGDISWTDPDNSVVGAITGPTTGKDVVLIGLSSETVAVSDPDFDNDGDVDGQDFIIWQRGVATGATNATGDADGSGSVNAADLAIWRGKFGQPPAVGAAAAVPEPGTAVLVALAGVSLVATRRRKASS